MLERSVSSLGRSKYNRRSWSVSVGGKERLFSLNDGQEAMILSTVVSLRNIRIVVASNGSITVVEDENAILGITQSDAEVRTPDEM